MRTYLLSLLCLISLTTQAQLNSRLDSLKGVYATKMGAEKSAAYDASVAEITKKTDKAAMPVVGAQAQALAFTDMEGKAVDTKALLKKGPLVLMFYRGGWCPYCNMTLRTYQSRYDDFIKAGAEVVAVSIDDTVASRKTIKRNGLTYPVYTDKNLETARRFGIVYDAGNGKSLPLGATYVINQEGKITYAFTETDYRRRAEPEEVLQSLQAAKSK